VSAACFLSDMFKFQWPFFLFRECATRISSSTYFNRNIQLSVENLWASFGNKITHRNMDKEDYGYDIVMRLLKVVFNESIWSFNSYDHKEKNQ